MKTIYPSSNSSSINQIDDKYVSKEDYNELVARLNTAISDLDLATNNFEAYKQAIAASFTTNTLNVNGTSDLNQIIADVLTVNGITSDKAVIDRIDSALIAASIIEATEIRSNSVNTGTVTASTSVTTPTVNTTNVNTNNIVTDNITINCGLELGNTSSTSLTTDTLTATSGVIADLTTTDLTVTDLTGEKATITDLEATNAEITNAEITNADLQFITHINNPQFVTEVADTGDYYILLPTFTNGNYFIEARNDGGTKLWSAEFINSINNVQFRWSQKNLGYIIDYKITTNADGSAKVQLHVNSLNEQATIYSQSQSTDNTLPPTIYSTDQLSDINSALDVVTETGTFIQDIIYTNKLHVQELEMDSLFMDCVGVKRELYLTCDFVDDHGIITPATTKGEVGQYISNQLICSQQVPSWTTPSDRIDSTDLTLTPSCVVANYNGIDYAGTYDCDVKTENYPIAHLNAETCVHGNIEVENLTTTDNLVVNCNTTTNTFKSSHIQDGLQQTDITCGLTNVSHDYTYTYEFIANSASASGCYCETCRCTGWWFCYDLVDPDEQDIYLITNQSCLVGPVASYCTYTAGNIWNYNACDKYGNIIYTEHYNFTSPTIYKQVIDTDTPSIGNWYRKEGNRLDELAVYNCDCTLADSKPVIYNEIANALQTTDSLDITDLEVDSLTVNCKAVIKGDLYVEGTTHTVEEETISTSSDMIVLRQNNNTGLASGDASGIIVNKYNGTDNLALVTDNTGTLRVGEVSGTTDTYTNIYYKNGIWYSNSVTTTVVTPNGELTSWDDKEISEGITHYTNAVFTLFNYSNLSPVLGRDEITSMTNNALLVFNCATWEANTITVPTTNCASLKYNTLSCSYYWERSAGNYCFADMASYNAVASDIPEGSIVVIADQNNYTVSEDK